MSRATQNAVSVLGGGDQALDLPGACGRGWTLGYFACIVRRYEACVYVTVTISRLTLSGSLSQLVW